MGSLTGVKIVELAGIGPAPFCGMMLADMGAEVLRIDRTQTGDVGLNVDWRFDLLNRGKKSVAVDLKSAAGRDAALRLIASADVLIEGFRPGVAERLGLGPDTCLEANPRLVYGRVTGWGQTGPAAQVAGHDINYIAVAGILAAIGRDGEAPLPPLNLIGDFGGGGMLLAFGVLAALHHAGRSGRGQIVDAAMTEGALLLMASILSLRAEGRWGDRRGTNSIDTGAPFYDVYETADGAFMAVGAVESRFYQALVVGLGLDSENLPGQWDEAAWPTIKAAFRAAFSRRTRAEWEQRFAELDACVTPVLDLAEAIDHPQMKERGAFSDAYGVIQPAPAPRFSLTPSRIAGPPCRAGQHSRSALLSWGFSTADIDGLLAAGALAEGN